jgi:signal peptidase I
MSENENDKNLTADPKQTDIDVDNKNDKKKKFWKEVKSISLIIFVVLFFRSIFFEPFKIPSGSMIPTLMIGDFILVNKFSYGLKVPFSDMFGDPIYITEPEGPKRGDVIVFKYPNDTSINYIKRVVGLPGDKVEVRNKVVFINDVPIKQVEIDGKKIMEDMDDKFRFYKFRFFQTKTGEHEHITGIHVDNRFNENHPAKIVPAEHYFVMGDNRDFSADSRYWGFVPFGHIKGKAVLVWFSIIAPWSPDPFKFRPWRIGTTIE